MVNFSLNTPSWSFSSFTNIVSSSRNKSPLQLPWRLLLTAPKFFLSSSSPLFLKILPQNQGCRCQPMVEWLSSIRGSLNSNPTPHIPGGWHISLIPTLGIKIEAGGRDDEHLIGLLIWGQWDTKVWLQQNIGFYFKKYSHDLMLQIKSGLLTLFEVISCFSGFFAREDKRTHIFIGDEQKFEDPKGLVISVYKKNNITCIFAMRMQWLKLTWRSSVSKVMYISLLVKIKSGPNYEGP